MADIFFLRLTMAATGAPVLVNLSQIRAVYKSGYGNDDKTLVDYSGTDNGYVEVLESIDSIVKMIQGANRMEV